MSEVVISLGSNLGESLEILQRAISELSQILTEIKVSPIIETEPWGNVDQPNFLNAVVIGNYSSSAHELLHQLQTIENNENRVRDIHWGPRTLDLDIIAFGDEVIEDSELTIPHPRAHERAFVLQPWLHLDPVAYIPHRGYVKDLIDLIK